jgi:hypothetical protein
MKVDVVKLNFVVLLVEWWHVAGIALMARASTLVSAMAGPLAQV